MAKRELLEKILADAKARAQEIKSEAKAKADALRVAAEEERAALVEGVRKVSAASAPDALKRARSMAELEGRKIALSRKQEVIAKAYDGAIDAILSDSRYEALLVKMIVSAAEEGDSVVFAASDYDRIDVKKAVAAASKKVAGLTVDKEKGAFRGGIVLRGKSCDKNLTLELELESLRSSGQVKYETLFD